MSTWPDDIWLDDDCNAYTDAEDSGMLEVRHYVRNDPLNPSLTVLSDRAQAHILGLEAMVKRLRLQRDELREQLNTPTPATEGEKRARQEGWKACASYINQAAVRARNELNNLQHMATQVYWQGGDELDCECGHGIDGHL